MEKKREMWRIVAAAAAVGWIVWTWVQKGIGGQMAGMPKEDMLPILLTTAAVSLGKVALIAAGLWLAKRIAMLFQRK
ncbi:MAG: hypothetical protein IJC54_04210 [Clostridia bacterium]|nr:hypothetical protein [Clostridia bacterium]